jgi:hypothetical protein
MSNGSANSDTDAGLRARRTTTWRRVESDNALKTPSTVCAATAIRLAPDPFRIRRCPHANDDTGAPHLGQGLSIGHRPGSPRPAALPRGYRWAVTKARRVCCSWREKRPRAVVEGVAAACVFFQDVVDAGEVRSISSRRWLSQPCGQMIDVGARDLDVRVAAADQHREVGRKLGAELGRSKRSTCERNAAVPELNTWARLGGRSAGTVAPVRIEAMAAARAARY